MENLHVYMDARGREGEAIKFMENTHAIFILNSHVVIRYHGENFHSLHEEERVSSNTEEEHFPWYVAKMLFSVNQFKEYLVHEMHKQIRRDFAEKKTRTEHRTLN